MIKFKILAWIPIYGLFSQNANPVIEHASWTGIWWHVYQMYVSITLLICITHLFKNYV